MEIHNIEIKQRLDKTSSEEVQDLDISFSVNQDGEEYVIDVTGQAFVKTLVLDNPSPTHNEMGVEVLLIDHYTYLNGFNVPTFMTDATEDELIDILKKHCT